MLEVNRALPSDADDVIVVATMEASDQGDSHPPGNNIKSCIEKPVDVDHIMWLFLVNSAWTLLMTFLPVLVDFPQIRFQSPDIEWYNGNDIVRLLEPIVALPLNFWILHSSGIFQRRFHTRSFEPFASVSIFMVGAAIYEQGAGFHSSSNMFKHPTEALMKQHPEVPGLRDLYKWMRDCWEHEVSQKRRQIINDCSSSSSSSSGSGSGGKYWRDIGNPRYILE